MTNVSGNGSDRPIDFVILWVNGADPKWQAEKEKYQPKKAGKESSASRFRDWDNLQYWFRAVEKYAPWVRKIHFVTWGHIPTWLNTESPKLNIVRHTDFIPEEYLPTFNSNAIELNLHRISDLSEQFVLFNDDMFLLKPVGKSFFFQNGLPCDEFIGDSNAPNGKGMIINHTNLNNMTIINRNFRKKAIYKKNFSKIFSFRYGKHMFRNLFIMPWKYIPGIRNNHLPISHLKSTFSKVWEKEFETLNNTSGNRFRGLDDVSHWVMRYWNVCSGAFVARSPKTGSCFTAPDGTDKAVSYIRNQKGCMVCINDASAEFDFEEHKQKIIDAFQSILPDKSEFEL